MHGFWIIPSNSSAGSYWIFLWQFLNFSSSGHFTQEENDLIDAAITPLKQYTFYVMGISFLWRHLIVKIKVQVIISPSQAESSSASTFWIRIAPF